MLREGRFKGIWVQPAASDAGGALGIAQLTWYGHCNQPCTVLCTTKTPRKGLTLVRSPPTRKSNISSHTRVPASGHLARPVLLSQVADLLAKEKVVGGFDGRMEFGPRALGSRSILGDPRSPRMPAPMNLKIKFRKGFRLFVPSALLERVLGSLEVDGESPCVLITEPVRRERRLPESRQDGLWGIDRPSVPRSDIPAVTPSDNSLRLQAVGRETDRDYYDLIKEFERMTGYGLLGIVYFGVLTPVRCVMRLAGHNVLAHRSGEEGY